MRILVPSTDTWRGFQKLHRYLIMRKHEITLLSSEFIEEFGNVLIYINSTKYLNEEVRKLIRFYVKRGAKLLVEVVPRSRKDINVLNKLLSGYGAEYTWIKIYDPLNNNGVPTNPIANPSTILGLANARIIVEQAYHLRNTVSIPLLMGHESALAMNPESNEVIPFPRGTDLVYAVARFSEDQGLQIVCFSGYVFRDTVLQGDNIRLLECILSLLAKS